MHWILTEDDDTGVIVEKAYGVLTKITWDHPRRWLFRGYWRVLRSREIRKRGYWFRHDASAQTQIVEKRGIESESETAREASDGELSKLLDMSLDILYEVNPRINPVTDDGILDGASDIRRCPFCPPDGSTQVSLRKL